VGIEVGDGKDDDDFEVVFESGVDRIGTDVEDDARVRRGDSRVLGID